MFKLYLNNITVLNSQISFLLAVNGVWLDRQLSQLELYLRLLRHVITILCLL